MERAERRPHLDTEEGSMPDNTDPANAADEHPDQSEMTEAEIDQNLADTFPASDPPSWTLGTDHSQKPKTGPDEALEDDEEK